MFRVLQQIIRSVHTTRSSKRFVKQNYLQFYLHFNFMLFKIVCACGFVSPTRQIVVVASLDASFCFGSFFCRWWRQLMLSFRCLTRETRLAAGASRWNRQCCRPAHKNALCCYLIKLVTINQLWHLRNYSDFVLMCELSFMLAWGNAWP